ncbi:hypothetical protein DF186_19540, partial [Enterococcus hirae]
GTAEEHGDGEPDRRRVQAPVAEQGGEVGRGLVAVRRAPARPSRPLEGLPLEEGDDRGGARGRPPDVDDGGDGGGHEQRGGPDGGG